MDLNFKAYKLKELLLKYAQYNLWANKKLADLIAPLSPDIVNTTIVSSFSSLHSTLQHMYNTEQAWWQRVKLVEHVVLAEGPLSADEVLVGLLNQSQE